MSLNDHQEQIVYTTLLDLMREIGVLNRDTLPSFEMLVSCAEGYTEHLRQVGDSRDALIKECFKALERRHADDLVDELKDRFGYQEE